MRARADSAASADRNSAAPAPPNASSTAAEPSAHSAPILPVPAPTVAGAGQPHTAIASTSSLPSAAIESSSGVHPPKSDPVYVPSCSPSVASCPAGAHSPLAAPAYSHADANLSHDGPVNGPSTALVVPAAPSAPQSGDSSLFGARRSPPAFASSSGVLRLDENGLSPAGPASWTPHAASPALPRSAGLAGTAASSRYGESYKEEAALQKAPDNSALKQREMQGQKYAETQQVWNLYHTLLEEQRATMGPDKRPAETAGAAPVVRTSCRSTDLTHARLLSLATFSADVYAGAVSLLSVAKA